MTDTLDRIASEVRTCQQCPLGAGRTRAVPGEGPVTARVIFIGEGPGFHEDMQGRPFVGASGHYLEELLAGVGLRRQDVYIANVIKCRPPGNRDPEPAELATCRDYLDRQLALIQPALIVTLGRFSMERHFPGQSITRIHGQPKRVGDAYYLPLFHPAAALRNADWREDMANDFALIPRLLAELEGEKAAQPEAAEPDDEEYTQMSLF